MHAAGTPVREEIANAVTHGIGAAVALAASTALVTRAALLGDGWQLAAALVFGISLVLLYLASTLYHAIPHARAKRRLKVFDHCAIYGLIAGTYTPFALVGMRDGPGWWLFGIVWALAAAGIVFKLFFTGRFRLLSTAIYLGMGWLVLAFAKPLAAAVDGWTLGWLIAGGVMYTAGTLFYQRPALRFSHSVWHGFVIAGSACHFVAVSAHLVPAG